MLRKKDITISNIMFRARLYHENTYADRDHYLIQLYLEDDTYWHKFGSSFDAYWLDDIIDVLQKIREQRGKKYIRHQTESI